MSSRRGLVVSAVPAGAVWAAAVDVPLVAWALGDYYRYPSANSAAHACPASHLAAVGWFILAFLVYSLVLACAGHACCSVFRVADTYVLSCVVFVWVLAMWVPIESFHLACAHGGLLWVVVTVHGVVGAAVSLAAGVAAAGALARDLWRGWRPRDYAAAVSAYTELSGGTGETP
jgi:hypothetical protein